MPLSTSEIEALLPPVLTPAEAADFLRLTVLHLARMRCDGAGPEYIKAGKKVLYTRTSIAGWLAKNTRLSTSVRPSRVKAKPLASASASPSIDSGDVWGIKGMV